jgi:tRNA pseudouridine38-40 synthase
MTIVRLDLAYHGARFAGWATQPGERTVQQELETALGTLLGEPPTLTVAGRTDAGVHAWAQVASFEIESEPPEPLRQALHALTGSDITVRGAGAAPDGFDARRDARSRTYCYRLLAARAQNPFDRDFALFWPYRLYPGLLESCAEALIGKHDFTAFTPTRTEHVRFERNVLRAEWRRGRSLGLEGHGDPVGGELFEFWIEADSFMRSMVRVIVGTMLEVGSGRRRFEDFTSLLEGAPRETAGDTARPHGLHLASVSY